MLGMNAIEIVRARPDSPDSLQLLKALDEELQHHPYPPASRHAFSIEQLLQQDVAFFISAIEGQPAGCGGLKSFAPDYGEVKRMYVRPSHRGLGLGMAMLNHLSHYAQSQGLDVLRLETGIYQVEAIRLYERYGFQRRAPFGEYGIDPMSVYFEKRLDSQLNG